MTTAAINEWDEARQRRAAEIDRIVENSFAARAQALILGVALNEYSVTPPDLASEIKNLQDRRQKIQRQCDDAVTAVINALQSSGDVTKDFEDVLVSLKLKKMPLLKLIIEWHTDALELARQHIDALRPIGDKLHTEAEQVVEAVKADLEGVGSGLASTAGYLANSPDAAHKQFDFQARMNTRSRDAIRKSLQAKADIDAAVEAFRQVSSRLAESQKMLRAAAVEAVASVA